MKARMSGEVSGVKHSSFRDCVWEWLLRVQTFGAPDSGGRLGNRLSQNVGHCVHRPAQGSTFYVGVLSVDRL